MFHAQARFAHDDRVYKAFLEILNMYRKGQKSIHAVYNEVRVWQRGCLREGVHVGDAGRDWGCPEGLGMHKGDACERGSIYTK